MTSCSVADDNTPLNLHVNGHAEDLRKSPNSRSDDPMSDDNNDIDDDNPSDDDKSAGKLEGLKDMRTGLHVWGKKLS